MGSGSHQQVDRVMPSYSDRTVLNLCQLLHDAQGRREESSELLQECNNEPGEAHRPAPPENGRQLLPPGDCVPQLWQAPRIHQQLQENKGNNP